MRYWTWGIVKNLHRLGEWTPEGLDAIDPTKVAEFLRLARAKALGASCAAETLEEAAEGAAAALRSSGLKTSGIQAAVLVVADPDLSRAGFDGAIRMARADLPPGCQVLEAVGLQSGGSLRYVDIILALH